MEKFFDTPTECSEQVTDCLYKIKDRLKDDSRALKSLKKIIPLFDKHEFWSTQPVMHVY